MREYRRDVTENHTSGESAQIIKKIFEVLFALDGLCFHFDDVLLFFIVEFL